MIEVHLVPFSPQKEKSKLIKSITDLLMVKCQVSIDKGVLSVRYLLEDKAKKIENFYPLDALMGAFNQKYIQDELWKNNCFEFFVKTLNSPEYFEFNANSKGNWNFYKLQSYRSSLTREEKIHSIHCTVSQDSLISLQYIIDLNPLFKKGDRLLFSFCSVILLEGMTTYWSNQHSLEKPDFHNANNFTIALDFQ